MRPGSYPGDPQNVQVIRPQLVKDKMQPKFANAVKAIISYGFKYLILKNALDDPNRPGQPDFPGGRLEPGENPYTGLKREIEEELGKDFAEALSIGRPIDIAHFERADGQTVTMMFFDCWTRRSADIKLSPEHSSYEWVDATELQKILSGFAQADIMAHAFKNRISYSFWEY